MSASASQFSAPRKALARLNPAAPALLMVLLAVLWQGLALRLSQPLLPTPEQVLATLWQHTLSGELSQHLGATLGRVLISFSLAMLLGTLLGMSMGIYPRANRLLDPLLVVLLNIPALVVILLLYIWLGMGEFAAIVAVVINKVPNVAVTLREGARCLDPQLTELARVYRVSGYRRLREILLPQLAPYFLIASRSGLALIWKIVLVVELLGRSDGVGFQLHLAFQMFDVPVILAYSLAFILIVQAVEWFVLRPAEQRQRRWREAGGQ
ncbi:ABC transporter permease [Motiliproteus sp. SC1-56]|uniref:ABC transporter permease n=1 Tax=Motiliproteus sp. SC1-56 TaxID=2799565 RepID=UPI001A8F4755|nr:ABC transporter permease [Motiliproteus sp. SC1-56]